MAKILIVDDSVELLELFPLILKLKGHEVATADSKEKMVESLTSFTPEVILMDIKLGHADGRELCREITSNTDWQHIPVILLSADPKLSLDHTGYGATAFIEKPFDIETINQTVAAVINKK